MVRPRSELSLAFWRPVANTCVWRELEIARDNLAMSNARELTARLADLLGREHAAMADFLVALADFDRERLWLDLGHSSLFYFLHRELGLSKGAAHYRKTAAELIQRFPEIVEPLRDGRLCITSVVELAKVITPDNRHDVLPRFFHRSKAEAKAVSAELCPAEAAPRREIVTALRVVPAAVVHLDEPQTEPGQAQVHPNEPLPVAAPSAARGERYVAEPVTADAGCT